jgi:hypothetical protein
MGTSLPRHEEVLEFLKAEASDSLRVVDAVSIEGDTKQYEHVYIREDVESEYSEEEQQRVMEDFVFHLLEIAYVEDLYNAGGYNYNMQVLDEATIIVLFEGEKRCTVVSVDPDCEDVLSLVRGCQSLLESESS